MEVSMSMFLFRRLSFVLYILCFLGDLYDLILANTNIALQSIGTAVHPSSGGPKYTIDTSVLPYTADTVGYKHLSGRPTDRAY